MSKKLLKTIILITIALMALYMPECYAAGANIVASTTSAKPGDTVELYIDLSTASIGYDLQISTDNDDLISSSEIVSNIGSGDTSRIYLVQLAGSEDRTIYPVGTRIATIKYTIAETATAGSTITLNVAGDVAGETSSDKNDMNESITINIIEASIPDEESEQQPEQEPEQEPEGEVNPPQEDGSDEQPEPGQEPEQEPEGEVNPPQQDENKEENDDTTATEILPNAGTKGFSILPVIILMVIMLIVIMYNNLKKYNKNKDIK